MHVTAGMLSAYSASLHAPSGLGEDPEGSPEYAGPDMAERIQDPDIAGSNNEVRSCNVLALKYS